VPLEHSIDHVRRIVFARGFGVLTDEDFFGYQEEVWSQSEVTGYDELVDMTAVEDVVVSSTERVHDLAALAASMDRPTDRSKFAIVAPDDLAFGLGRMFETMRSMMPESTKKVRVVRTRAEALEFLGIDPSL
jgi:hypothetical protein